MKDAKGHGSNKRTAVKLIGFQIGSERGYNLHRDEFCRNSKIELYSFEVLDPACAATFLEMCRRQSKETRFTLIPIFDGEIRNPYIIGRNTRRDEIAIERAKRLGVPVHSAAEIDHEARKGTR